MAQAIDGSDWSDWSSSDGGDARSRPIVKATPTVVIHRYHDHSQDPPAVTNSSVVGQQPNDPCRRRGAAKQFPSKLYEMLSRAHEEGFESVVSWQPHGRCFIVRRPDCFASTIMPRYVHSFFGTGATVLE